MAVGDVTPLLQWDIGSCVYWIAVSNDGTRIVSGSDDRLVHVWDVHHGILVVGPLKGHSNAVWSVAWSHDDAYIASGSEDYTIRIWDSCTGALKGKPLKGHTAAVQSVMFSSNGNLVISCSSDSTIRVWDTSTGALIGVPITGHTRPVSSVAISTDSTCIISASYDNTIRFWNPHAGTSIGEPLRRHTNDANSVAFSPDNTRVVSGSDDRTICIWDRGTGTLIGEPLIGHTGPIWSVAFSPNNSHIVSGSDDNTVRIWDARTGSPVGEPLRGHTSGVRSVAFVPDSCRIVSCSSDKTIRIWEVPQLMPSFDTMTISTAVQKKFEYLIKNECTNLSLSIDPTQYSSSAVISGRFSDVRKVKMRNGILVAVKCLRSQIILEGDKRTMSELQKWSKAQHENIKELLGVVMFQGQIGLVSVWMNNGTLHEYIQTNPSVNRYLLCVQVAKGVSYLHEIGMVHGDIRMSNVLVSVDGVAKLNDFDYSILSEGTSKFSKTNQLSLGTLRWMAPELLQKQEEDNPPIMRNKSTDVYALGMTMLEIFTGRVPYDEYNYEMAIYGALYQKELPRRPKELPEENKNARRMWELLAKCWNHDPSGRPDAGDIAPAMKIFIL